MSTVSTASELNSFSTTDGSNTDAFDISSRFDQWLQLQVGLEPLATQELESPLENSEVENSGIPDESVANCRVTFAGALHFEGVLHLDGSSVGNISSPDGTLVLTKPGRIEGDVDVGVAVIGGCIIGNVTATERVVLESGARVTGQIQTPALSMSWGAVFDGDCAVPASPEPIRQGDPLKIISPTTLSRWR